MHLGFFSFPSCPCPCPRACPIFRISGTGTHTGTGTKWLVILLLLGGCISVSKQEVESSLEPTPELSHSLAQAASSTSFTAGEWPSEEWWEIFRDPQLSRYITTALEESPTIQVADARVEMARQIAKEKRSLLFPEIDFDPNANFQYLSKNGFFRSFAPQIPGHVTDIFFTLNLSYDLDLFGKNRHLFRAALDQYKAEKAEAAQVRLAISAQVAKAYFELQTDRATRGLLKKTENRRRSLLYLHTERRKIGLDTEIDLLKVQEQLLEIEKELSQIDESIELDEHMLRVLMGKSPDSADKLAVLNLPFDEPIALPQDLSTNLLSRRPDLMAQIWRVESMAEQIGAARAAFYPDINLTAFAGTEGIHFNQILKWASRTSSIFPAIRLPIFTGGRLQADLNESWAQFHEATAAYHELLLKAVQEVVDQLTMLMKLADQLHIQKLTVDNLYSRTSLAYQRYTVGVTPYMEALQTEERLYGVEQLMIDLQLMQREACINLIKALGGGYESTTPLTPSKCEVTSG